MRKSKVLVVGIDGATWALIKPWADEGRLPTFRKLLGNGAWGELRSSIPYMTYPAWKCYSTGKNPGKLGVYWFLGLDFKKRRIVTHSSLSFKADEFWDYLGRQGFKVGIINMPTTYPPKKIHGFMISGFGASNESEYTTPPSLKRELEEEFDYKVNPSRWIKYHSTDALEDLEELISSRFRVAQRFIPEVDFMHLTIFFIDNIQHYFWNDKKILLRFYQKIDKNLGRLVRSANVVFLMSDHGFTALKDVFYINVWLAEKGYLVRNKSYRDSLSQVGITFERLASITDRTKLLPYLYSKLPDSIRSRIKLALPADAFDVTFNSLSKLLDWESTLVVALESTIYLNKEKIESKTEYEKLRTKLIRQLSAVKNPSTNEKVFRRIFRKEEIYSGEHLDVAPDLVVVPAEGYEVKLTLYGEKAMWESELEKGRETRKRYGVHSMKGIFLAFGDGIKKGIRLEGASIYDLAPTILHICNIPIPEDLDGRILAEIL
jgi:predicted AlkP superfamily phosphohydrolase/phosphomutase